MATVVTIGRNVRNVPMSATEWERFTTDVLRAVRSATRQVYFVGTGEGIYDGTTEEAFTVIAADIAPGKRGIQGKIVREDLKRSLALLADTYGQECVAVTEGITDFVYSIKR